MGNGTFAAGKFNLIVSLRYNASTPRLAEWRAAFEQASKLLFDATDGQHQLGNIYICNNQTGTDIADLWLKMEDLANGQRPMPTGFSALGVAQYQILLYNDDRFKPFQIVHELGHYLYGLYDEYLAGLGQTGKHCIGVTTATACIMEAGWNRGDRFGAAGLGGPLVTGSVSEFCTDGPAPQGQVLNYHSFDNMQHENNEHSCWYTMKHGPIFKPGGYPGLRAPGEDPAIGPAELPGEGPARAGVPPANWPAPAPINWTILVEEQRFVLVIDRSGSMTGDKLDQTKVGANYWADGALINDRLGIISFSHTVSVNYPIQQIVAGMNRTPLHDAIATINAGGTTAIGDGLRAGMNQILGDGKRGWQNVIALVTDGYHNFGEDPLQVVPDLIDKGIRVYAIGIGPDIDANLLQEIATRTNGAFYRIPPSQNQQGFEVGNDLILIEGIAHNNGGLVISVPGSTNPGAREEEAYVEPGSEMATFILHWHNRNDLLYLELEDPNGKRITLNTLPANTELIYSQRSYMGFRVKDPVPGLWKLIVNPEKVAEIAYFHLFAFSKNLRIGGGLRSPWYSYKPGEVVPLQFQCFFDQPLTGLKVTGTVTTPVGNNMPLEFADDGNKELGDVLPGDGLYSTIFRKTHQQGIYTFDVLAESDGQSASYPKYDHQPDKGEEFKKDPIPAFRRQFTLTVAVGEEPVKRVEVEPNRSHPGGKVQATVKGKLTHFRQGSTAFDFGERIKVSDIKVVDDLTALVTLDIDKSATLGPRNVVVTTELYQERVEAEGGFQVVGRTPDRPKQPAAPLPVCAIALLMSLLLLIMLLLGRRKVSGNRRDSS